MLFILDIFIKATNSVEKCTNFFWTIEHSYPIKKIVFEFPSIILVCVCLRMWILGSQLIYADVVISYKDQIWI